MKVRMATSAGGAQARPRAFEFTGAGLRGLLGFRLGISMDDGTDLLRPKDTSRRRQKSTSFQVPGTDTRIPAPDLIVLFAHLVDFVVTAAPDHLPQPLADQLSDGGAPDRPNRSPVQCSDAFAVGSAPRHATGGHTRQGLVLAFHSQWLAVPFMPRLCRASGGMESGLTSRKLHNHLIAHELLAGFLRLI
jgi:hypothetical protein